MQEKEILSESFTSYDLMSLESAKLKSDLREKNKSFKCEIPSGLLGNRTLEIEENEIRTTDFQSFISNGKEKTKLERKKECDTYKGYIDGDEE